MLKVKSKSSNNSFLIKTLLICNIITLTLPIFEIAVAFIYKNKISCTAVIVVNIGDWLIIKGVLSLVLKISLSLYLYYGRTSLYNCLAIAIGYIINLTLFSWLIIGSFLFWGNCYKLEPDIVNITMWISLLFGIFSCSNFESTINAIDSIKDEQSKTPMLDIA